MSPTRAAQGKTWYTANYEKLIVIAVLVALLFSALLLVVEIGQANRALDEARWDVEKGTRRPYKGVDTATYTPFMESLEQPFQIRSFTNNLLVSELRVLGINPNPEVRAPIPFDATVCPFTGFPQPEARERSSAGDGIPDGWKEQYGLDILSRDLASADLDGDGFTVYEEWQAKTDPIDPKSHPSYATKLQLQRVVVRPFTLRFQGVSEVAEGEIRFNLNDVRRGQSYFAKVGDTVEGFKVLRYRELTRPGPMGPQDASVLVLERAGKTIELRINQDYTEQERGAILTFLVDQSEHRVTKGDSLTLMGQTLKVVDITDDQVLIRDEKLGINVPVTRGVPRGGDPVVSETGAEGDEQFMELLMEGAPDTWPTEP